MRTSSVALAVLFLALQFESAEATAASAKAVTAEQARSGSKSAQNPVFRLDVRRVPVDIVVTDKQGNPVRGLKKSDFTIMEDGAVQKALSFEYEDGSVPSFVAPKLPPLPNNTFVNMPSEMERGPLYILYYDLVNTPLDDQMTFRQELMKFVDEAQPGTRIALIVNAKGLHMLQGFTTDHLLLRDAILRKGSGPHIPDVFLFGENYGANDVGGALSNLTFIAEYLEGIRGRKNLLWLSTDFPIPVTPTLAAGTTGSAIAGAAPQLSSVGAGGGPEVLDLTELERENIKRTYAALMRAQIALYPIDVSGVTGALGKYDKMRMIAGATGGHAYYSDNRPHFLVDKAVEHGETYYTLSYAPSNAKFDGSERHIEVKLTKPGDYKVTYRTGYYAVSDDEVQQEHKKDDLQARFITAKAADTLYANIEHGAPMLHDLLFTAHLSAEGTPEMATAEQMTQLEDSPVYFRTRKKNKTLKPLKQVKMQKYVIDYGVVDRQLKSLASKGGKTPVLEFAAAAYDADGRLLNSILNEGLISPPVEGGGKPGAAFHATQELQAPPGAAWIRVAVRDKASDRTGTLEVPLPLKPDMAKVDGATN